jgi:hypothetical protein
MNMKKKILLLVSILFLSIGVCAEKNIQKKGLKAESNLYEVNGIRYTLKKRFGLPFPYNSNKTRIWYSFIPANNKPSEKPLFVLINGGPGCGTCVNLFSMNTAKYTMDRNLLNGTGQISKENPYSWTKLGNLLYIDAPNSGFSYMVSDSKTRLGVIHDFLGGGNYNSFIDADQVLRTVLHFIEEHPALQKNKVIFVGESYSGVRVSTMLNLILYYSQYEENHQKNFRDPELKGIIEKYLGAAIGAKAGKYYTPEQISEIFSHQILIQPQIVDEYQDKIKADDMIKQNSIMDKLGKEAKAKKSWREFYKDREGKYGVSSIVTLYLKYINRDQYHYLQPWSWSDDNEEFALMALRDVDNYKKVTGTDIEDVNYMHSYERVDALRFLVQKTETNILQHNIVKLLFRLSGDEEAQLFLEMFPFNSLFTPPDVQREGGRTIGQVLGGLSEYDNYIVGTNPFVFMGFMANAGIQLKCEDIFGIDPGTSKIYGTMFLENLAVVETFMTNAEYDMVVYSPSLPKQFDCQKGRFIHMVSKLEINNGNGKADGSFTIHYNKRGIKGLKHTPESRTVTWPYYGKSGHSVSTTQPGKFLNDIDAWLNTPHTK